MSHHFEHAACGLLTTDVDGTIVAVNQTLLGWIGAERSDLVGRRRFADLLTGGGRIYHETHFVPMLAMQGSAREIAFDLVCVGGDRLPVLVNARIDVAEGERVVHVAVFDATERRSYERELLAAKERAERSQAEIQVLARALQDTLLPHRLPTVPGLDLAAAYLPAGAGHEIGGDFYDVFQVGPDDWVIALGDVEGKGVEAAIVTSLVRHTIRSAAVEHEPSGVLGIVNQVLIDDDTRRFCTAVVLRCRQEARGWRLTVSCGGHPMPVQATTGGVSLFGKPGSLLGMFPEVRFHDVEVALDGSSVVVAYTDGVSEARRGRELFGEDRITELVDRSRELAVEDVVQSIVAAALEFGGNPNRDDIAVIAIRAAAPTID